MITWVDGLISPHIIVNCITQFMSLRCKGVMAQFRQNINTYYKDMTNNKEFTCYVCDKSFPNKKLGGTIGNNLIPAEKLCTDCVHKNGWSTDQDLTQHVYSELQARKHELLQRIQR